MKTPLMNHFMNIMGKDKQLPAGSSFERTLAEIKENTENLTIHALAGRNIDLRKKLEAAQQKIAGLEAELKEQKELYEANHG